MQIKHKLNVNDANYSAESITRKVGKSREDKERNRVWERKKTIEVFYPITDRDVDGVIVT